MKLKSDLSIILSNDNVPSPIQIRFQDTITDIDAVLATKSITREDNLGIGSHVIDLGAITAGNFIFLKSSQDVDMDIDGEVLHLLASKPNMLYLDDFAVLTLTVAVAAEITLAVAGT